MQGILQVQELFPLPFHQPGHGNAGPAAHDPGDFLLGHLIPQEAVFAPAFFRDGFFLFQLLLQLRQLAVFQLRRPVQVIGPLGALDLRVDPLDVLPQLRDLADGFLFGLPPGLHGVEFIPLLRQLPLHLFQMRPGQLIVVLLQGRLLDLQLHDPAPDIVQLRRQGIDLRPDQGAGFIHQVNRLIRQEPVGDIPVGKRGGGDQGAVLNLDAVEDLVTLLQAPEDGDGILHRRLRYHDRLEPALQRRVLLDILPVLVERGRADAVQLAAGQHGLQQVAGVHGAVRLARADDGMQLIDEQNNPPVALFDFRQHGLQPLLKFSPELGAGDQGAHIQ